MIESVYNNDSADVNRTSKVQSTFKMPKNIRQFGKTVGNRKIYVEDYVTTYIKQLAGSYETVKIAVLVGQYAMVESTRCIFISGAVEVEEIDTSNELMFTNDTWSNIYDHVNQYFENSEIVGWFFGGPTYQLEDYERICKVHRDNFAGQDRTLLTYDNMEKEETFYLYENNRLSKQDGYYIYYEKNEAMQNYMIERVKSMSTEDEFEDNISQEIRSVIQQKKSMIQIEDDKTMNRMMYAAGTLLAVIILVVGAAIFNNFDQMKDMKLALETLSNNLAHIEKNQAENITPASVPSNGESLDVNVLPGEVKPIEKEAKPTKKSDEKDTKQEKTPSTSPPSKSEEPKEVKYYTVVSGDSLAGISYKLYSSANFISEIKELNNLEDEDMIYIGQKLIVP